jgi:uncharacterized membrane protein YhdT
MQTIWSRLLRAWLLTAVLDALFSSSLVKFAYGSTVTRLWQGVASVPLGPSALEGGTRTALIGLAMHFGVALTWSVVFLLLYEAAHALRAMTSSMPGVFAVACVYGPLIWIAMSFVVIPHFTHRPPTVNYRWWVQFFGHIPFVALPIVASIARGGRTLA